MVHCAHQCYVSRYKDSEAWRTDAFSFSWSHFFAYIFSPFSIILRVLNKIEMDEADCVVIVPCWETRLVSPACSPHERCTDFINRVQTSLVTPSPLTSTSHPEQVQNDSLPLIRQILQTSSIPAVTVRIIIASWRR